MGDGADDALNRALNQELADMIAEEEEGIEFAGRRIGPPNEISRARRRDTDLERLVRSLPFPFN